MTECVGGDGDGSGGEAEHVLVELDDEVAHGTGGEVREVELEEEAALRPRERSADLHATALLRCEQEGLLWLLLLLWCTTYTLKCK